MTKHQLPKNAGYQQPQSTFDRRVNPPAPAKKPVSKVKHLSLKALVATTILLAVSAVGSSWDGVSVKTLIDLNIGAFGGIFCFIVFRHILEIEDPSER